MKIFVLSGKYESSQAFARSLGVQRSSDVVHVTRKEQLMGAEPGTPIFLLQDAHLQERMFWELLVEAKVRRFRAFQE